MSGHRVVKLPDAIQHLEMHPGYRPARQVSVTKRQDSQFATDFKIVFYFADFGVPAAPVGRIDLGTGWARSAPPAGRSIGPGAHKQRGGLGGPAPATDPSGCPTWVSLRGGLLDGILFFVFAVRLLGCSWGVRGRQFRPFPFDVGGPGAPGRNFLKHICLVASKRPPRMVLAHSVKKPWLLL